MVRVKATVVLDSDGEICRKFGGRDACGLFGVDRDRLLVFVCWASCHGEIVFVCHYGGRNVDDRWIGNLLN